MSVLPDRDILELWRRMVFTVLITNTDDAGQDREVEIPFMKGYIVFNTDQIEGLPETYYEVAEPMPDSAERAATAESFFAATEADIRHGGNQAFYAVDPENVQMHPSRLSKPKRRILQPSGMRSHIGPVIRSGLTAALAANAGATRAILRKSLSRVSGC